MIDWNNIINTLKDGEVRTIGEDFYLNKHGEFNEIIKLWSEAGYKKEQVEWINYYPNIHFEESVTEQFGKLINLKHVRSWISCIRPGKSAPWHQDIDDNIDKYINLGELERYTCMIADPYHGQVLSIEDTSYYMCPVNTLIKWPHYLAWHGASNCGFNNYYLYHFLGYR